ncbi:MAG: formylmethanofuran--tetrahydromethanopterin N-formyltransferase [Pirellulales bacterium]
MIVLARRLCGRASVEISGTRIEDTFAEAFRMRYVRLVVTAQDEYWLEAAARAFTGYSSSIISCDSETGVERRLAPDETPDGRPGAAILVFGFSPDGLAAVVPNRTGQCLMTCPTTAVYDGLSAGEARIPLGKTIRYFGDGFQKSKLVAGRRYWRIPVMDGEFVIEHLAHVEKGVGGGNFIVEAATLPAALAAARRAIGAIDPLPGVITPFPGGVARCGSKVGSRYKGLKASTADAYCPSLRGRVETKLAEGAAAAYEIVIDGVDEASVAAAMSAGIRAAAGEGVIAITAGNYGGQLGKFHFHLRQLVA